MAIEVQVVSNSKAAQQDLSRLQGSIDNIGKSIDSTTASIKSMMVGLGSAIASIATVSSLAKVTDELTTITSKIKLATSTQLEFNTALNATKDIALSARTNLADVVTLYSKVALSAKTLGATQKQVTSVTSSIAKAITLSGSTTAEASATVLQLGQALASGKLQGDELRSVLENAPVLASQIAEGLGMSVSQMRTLAAEGRVTSKDVFEAILKQQKKIESMSGNMGITFAAAFTNIKNSLMILYDGFLNFGSKGSNNKSLASYINDVALEIAKMGKDFELTVLRMRTNFWLFVSEATTGVRSIGANMKGAFGKVEEMASGAAKNAAKAIDFEFKGLDIFGMKIKFNLQKINLKDFIPQIEPMKQLVLNWVKVVEHAFWWLYDRVIGHSWIPDLVNGIKDWMSLLLKDPLSAGLQFVNTIEGAFKRLFETLATLPGVDIVIKKLTGVYDAFSNTKFGHNVKQVFGLQDSYAGIYSDRSIPGGYGAYDTNARVGRGTHRSSENRPFLHDITNAFRSENQMPFLAGLATVFTSAILTAVTSGSIIKTLAVTIGSAIVMGVGGATDRLIPLFSFIGLGIAGAIWGSGTTKLIVAAITTAFGLLSANIVSDKEISLTTANIAKAFIDGVTKAVSLLFGSGIFGEKGFGGTLALVAKLALLFEKGREAAASSAKAIALAPMKMVDNLNDRFNAGWLDRQSKKIGSTINDSPAKVAANLAKAQQNLNDFYTKLANSSDRNGNRVGYDATRFRNASTDGRSILAAGFGKDARDLIRTLPSLERTLASATAAQTALPGQLAALTEKQNKINEQSSKIKERIAEGDARLKQGVISGGAGIGAIFGTLGGFNIGAKIAEQMVGYSDWSKIGVQMASSFVGQGLGAAVGTVIASTFIAAILSPLTYVGVAIAGAIYAVLNKDKIVEWFGEVTPVISEWAALLKTEISSAFSIGATLLYDKLKEVFPGVTNLVDYFTNSGTYSDEAKKKRAAERPSVDFIDSLKNGAKTLLDWAIPSARADSWGREGQQFTLQQMVAAIRKTEGSGSDQKSFAGAVGSMQIIKDTFDGVVKQHGLKDLSFENEKDRVFVATRHIADLMEKYKDPMKVFAAYNGGPSAVGKDGSLVDRKTVLNGKVIDTSTYYAERAYAALTGTAAEARNLSSSTASNAKRQIEAAKKTITTEFDAIRKDPMGYAKELTDNILKKFNIKSNELEGPPVPTKEELLSATLLSSKLKKINNLDGSLEKINEAISEIGGKSLSATELKAFPADALKDIVDNFDYITKIQAQLAENLSSYERLHLEKLLEEWKKKNNALISDARKISGPDGGLKETPTEDANKAGRDYAENVRKEFSAGLSAAMKGEGSNGLKQFGKNFLSNMGKTVSDAFSKGLTDQFFKQSGLDSFLGNVITNSAFVGEQFGRGSGKSINAGVGSLFEKDTKPAAEMTKGAAEAEVAVVSLWDRFKAAGSDAFGTVTGGLLKLGQNLIQMLQNSSFGQGVSQAVTGAGDWLSTAFGAVKSWAGYATGGYVSGPGTGTSDSIPAMLSNGEYVINAEAAAKFKPILDAINTGQFGKFSEGGGVGDFGAGSSSFNTGTFGSGFMDSVSGFNFTSFTASVNNSIGNLSTSVDGVSNGFSLFTDAQKSFFQTSNNVLGDGFNEVGKGMFSMGQLMQSGFMAVGLAMVNMQKPGKFNYVGAALTIASAAFGVYSAAGASSTAVNNTSGVGYNSPSAQSYAVDTPSVSGPYPLKYATGGYISGPGTATSDSIPAMLSNGEFVVRASAVDKWRPLLEAINSGRPAKFSDGGIVEASATMSTLKDGFKTSSASNGASTQTFNINVTGDVSRQTRREIQEMIPVIAVGVNSHNSERGKGK